MRIAASSVNMSANSSSTMSSTKEESLNFWVNGSRLDLRSLDSSVLQPEKIQMDVLELSDEGKSLQEQWKSITVSIGDSREIELELDEKDKQKILAIQKMIEALTGKKFKFYVPKKIKLPAHNQDIKIQIENTAALIQKRQNWGLEYNYRQLEYESEKMSFSSQGSIKTSDGREIGFSVQLNMSREFIYQSGITFKAGDARIDPLVINFGGNAPGLTEKKFSFDLDSDGNSEQISFTSKGSGFLALDLNGDGIVNNGTELFGPNSGNGFIELSKYDSDGNNWIDENDPVYEKLRIWTKDAGGKDTLFALGQKGIGAIYLGNVDTSFSINSSDNTHNGQVQKTGIFIKEDGTAGTVNHIDLAI